VKIFEKVSAARMNNIKNSPKEQSIAHPWHLQPGMASKGAFAGFPSYLPVFDIGNFDTNSHWRIALRCIDSPRRIARESARVAFV
jgi:hypothetical protein